MFFWIVFGLALKKSLVSFRHDLRFSADAHRHQVFSWAVTQFKQVGLRFFSPLEGLDQHHLSLGCEVRLLRHPALPLVHQLSLVRTFWYHLWSFMYSYICLCRSCEEKRHEIQEFNYFFSSLMRGLGRHWGEISSSSWGKETAGKAWHKCQFRAKFGRSWAKNPDFYWRNQKFCSPHNGKPT